MASKNNKKHWINGNNWLKKYMKRIILKIKSVSEILKKISNHAMNIILSLSLDMKNKNNIGKTNLIP